MYGLTLWRPWGWSIIHGPKRLENRPWAPWAKVIGKRIAVHAGAKYDKEGAAYIAAHLAQPQLVPTKEKDPQGIIGTAIVENWIEKEAPNEFRGFLNKCPDGQDVWFFGPIAWVLRDVRALPKPIPCKGALGLWTVPEDIAARIAEAA